MEPKRFENGAFDPIGLQFAKRIPKDLKMSLQRELLGVCGGLWVPFGNLVAAFGYPNGGPGRPKRVQKTSKSGFVDTSKTIDLLMKNLVFARSGSPKELKK